MTTEQSGFMQILEKNKLALAKSFVHHYYQENNLDLALESRNEIMVVCDSYYALTEDVKIN